MRIALGVCVAHLFILFTLIAHHRLSRTLRPMKPIAVRTIIPQVAVKPAAPVVAAAPKKAAAPVVAAAPTKKKQVAPKDEGLVKEIASHEAARKEAKGAPKKELPIPKKIESKPTETAAIAPPNYAEFLIGYLQEALILPERGDVRVKLVIDRFGKLLDCEILETKSAKNGEFLKNRLPELAFPCLNDFDIFEATQTFTIAFRNVEAN
jgi:hypothetical protein